MRRTTLTVSAIDEYGVSPSAETHTSLTFLQQELLVSGLCGRLFDQGFTGVFDSPTRIEFQRGEHYAVIDAPDLSTV